MKTDGIFALLVAALCSGCVLEKHCLSIGASGIVLDSQSQLPLSGASASVPNHSGKSRPVITRANGLFLIRPVTRLEFVPPFGDYALRPAMTLVVEKSGYVSTNIGLWEVKTNFVVVALVPVTK